MRHRLLRNTPSQGRERRDATVSHKEATVKSTLACIMAALLFLASCASTKNMTPEELEAIRKSNERYERSKGP